MICPNLSDPVIRKQFNELKSTLGEPIAYYVWDKNQGYPLDLNADGTPSDLFKQVLDLTGDRKKTIQDRIRIVQVNMWRVEVNVDTENAKSLNWWFVSALQNARYPERNETSQSTSTNYNPIHDQTSHYRTSFEYLINFIIEQEESMWIIWGKRQEEREKTLIQKPNYITWQNEWVYE